MTRRGPTGGFTLVELVVAMTATVLVAGGTVAILRAVVAARQRVDQEMAWQQEANNAIGALAAALRNAYRTSAQDWVLEGTQAWAGSLPADRVRFFTVSHRTLRPDQPECDVRECEFFLAQVEGEPTPALMRRLDPTRNDPPRGRGVLDRLAGNVVGLALAYHDGARWLDQWPASSRQWPDAIRVQLLVAHPQRPGTGWPVCQVINFPYRPQAPSSPAGEPSQPGRPAGKAEASGPQPPPQEARR